MDNPRDAPPERQARGVLSSRPLRFPSRAPVVWRDPTTMQIGVERALLVLHPVSHLDEAVVAVVAAGRADGGAASVAAQVRADRAAVDAVVERLRPALAANAASSPRHADVVRLAGGGPVADETGRLLESEGVGVVRVDAETVSGAAGDVRSASSRVSGLGVVVAGLVPDPRLTAEWMRHDVAHLVVRQGDRGVSVGPVVVPGLTACTRCLHLRAGEADPAWPAIAAQLATTPPAPPSMLVGREAAVRAARRVLDAAAALRQHDVLLDVAAGPARLAALAALALVERIDHETGEVTRWRPRLRPDCGCAAPPGTGSGDARRRGPDPRRPTTGGAAREPG